MKTIKNLFFHIGKYRKNLFIIWKYNDDKNKMIFRAFQDFLKFHKLKEDQAILFNGYEKQDGSLRFYDKMKIYVIPYNTKYVLISKGSGFSFRKIN